jgi:hypothetical protein
MTDSGALRLTNHRTTGQVHYDGRRDTLRGWLRLLLLVAEHVRPTKLV